ncbi:cfem domain-containing protein [Colletotrichum tabaci]|uniref:Cfem domain-containing protein n=1 Tax=Colletotrichum tabaci TaxID=1209068 RepID=A0AAV9TIN1_9PEZI
MLLDLLARERPPHPDVLTIPTPPLQQTALFIVFFFPALSIFTFGLRAYGRLTTRQWGLDDWLCGLAVLFAVLMTPPFFMFIKLGYFGWRAVDVPKDHDMKAGLWWNFLVQMFYNPVLALVKASVLVFLLRLGGQKEGVRLAIHGLNVFNACHAVAIFFAALFQCLPIEANWDFPLRAEPGTKCIGNSFHVIASCLTIFSDILVLALPFWIFLGLRMPMAAKMAVIGVFLMGIVVTVVAVIRVVQIYKLFFVQPSPGTDNYHDIGLTTSTIEVNLAIFSACVPALRPLFRRWMPKLFGGGTTHKKSDRTDYYDNYATGSRRKHAGTQGEDDIILREMRSKGHRAEIRSVSPTGSEEGIMTYNGIVRTTNVKVHYESHGSVDGSRSSTDFKSSEVPAKGAAF